MTDFLVDTPGGNCGNQNAGAGASLTSGVTYDGSSLSCLGITPQSQNLNTILNSINTAFCTLSSTVSTNGSNITTLQSDLTTLTSRVDNLDVSQIEDINSYSCFTPAGSTLQDTLTAMSNYLCGVSGLTETQVKDLEGTESGWKWRQRAGGHIFNEGNTFTWTPSTGLNGTINSGWVSPPEGLPRPKPALPLGLAPNRDNWIYANADSGVTYTDTVIGAAMPAPTTKEVILYKITTDATNITATEDLRVFQPFDETLFTPTTNLSGFIPTGSLAPTALDLSSVISYDTAVPIIANENIVHKKYVDDSIAALSTSLWTDLGGGSGIYYNAAPVGIGTSSPDASSVLTISGALKYINGSEGAGKILQSDSNGFATWVDIVAGSIDIENEGIALGQMATLNFIGAGVSAVDMGGGVVDVIITGSVSAFNDLSDVSVGGAVDKQTLRFNGTSWISSSSLQNTGSRISIGDSPATIDSKLHILDASGDDLLKVVGTGGTYFDIDSAGVSKFSTFVRYTETNGGANPLGSGKVLSDIDGTGKLGWIDFAVSSTLSDVLGFGNTTGANWISINNGYGLTNTDTFSGESVLRKIDFQNLGNLRIQNYNNTTTISSLIDLYKNGNIVVQADAAFSVNSPSFTVSGSGTFDGIIYGSDYSANYVNRSLVDKEYVDTAVSGVSGIGGSGTLNRVAKFTPDGTTLGDSLIQDDGTTIGIGTSPSASIFFQNSSALNQTSRSLNTSTAVATKIAIEGNALGANGVNIGLYGYATNGTTNYSIRLQDGTEAAGKFLKSITANGEANWASLTESDISDLGTYAKIGTYTDSYVPRWNATTNTLTSGTIQDDGTTIGVGIAPNATRKLFSYSNSLIHSVYGLNQSTSGGGTGVYGKSDGATAGNQNYGVQGIASGATGASSHNIGVLGSGGSTIILPSSVSGMEIGVYGNATSASLDAIGVASSSRTANSADNIGLYVHVANAGAGSAYIGKFIDGNEGAGKVLTSDANGLATWQTPASSSSSGEFGISNSSGVYTYYATLTLAMAAAVSGDTVEMFADVEETGSVTITLKDGVTINGNGHTYTLNVDDTANAFTFTISNGEIYFNNIKIVRTGRTAGTTTGATLNHINNTVKCQGAIFENDYGRCVIGDGGSLYNAHIVSYLDGVYAPFSSKNIYDSNIKITGTGKGAYLSSGNISNCHIESTIGDAIYNGTGKIYNSVGIATNGIGIVCNGEVYDSVGRSTSSTGVHTQRATNCVGISTSGVGINSSISGRNCVGISTSGAGGTGEFHNSTLISSSNYGFNGTGSKSLYNCYVESTSNIATFRPNLYNCTVVCKWNNAGGHCTTSNVLLNLEIVNSSFKVTNASAYCLNAYGGGVTFSTWKYANNTFEGSTTPITPFLLQGITNTSDSQGNILI